MADVKWIKILTDIFDDEKILLIESMPDADAIIVIWFKLLCLAGKQNNSGVFMLRDRIPYTDEMLATIFRRKPAVVKLALQTFEQFGMIEVVNGVVTIPNWEKHQQLDALERAREATRIRVANHRARQKAIAEGKETGQENSQDACNVTPNVTLTVGNADRIDIDKNKNRCSIPRVRAREEELEIDTTTVEAYASNALHVLLPGNMEELASFKDDFPDDVIRHAIDEAGAAGVRTWNYVRKILLRYLDEGIRTMDDVRKAERARGEKRKPAEKPIRFY